MECRGDQEPNLFIHDRNMMILRAIGRDITTVR